MTKEDIDRLLEGLRKDLEAASSVKLDMHHGVVPVYDDLPANFGRPVDMKRVNPKTITLIIEFPE